MITVSETIKQQMSSASKSRTAESRKQGGAKAWQTRILNLRVKLARPANRKSISRKQAGE